MKYLLTVILAIYLVSGPLFPRIGTGQTGSGKPDDLSGIFVLVEDTPLRVSIDTGWERNGNIPVFLVFNDLEVILEINTEDLSRAVSTETFISEMLTGDMNLPFVAYEKNPLRTRMALPDKRKPVKLNINEEKGEVEVYVGDSRLKLPPLRVKLTGIAPGELYELMFIGPGIRVRQRGKLVFSPSRGIIYYISYGSVISDIPTELSDDTGWSEWAVRIEPENNSVLPGVRERER